MFPSSEFLFNDRRTLHEQRFTKIKTLKTSYIQLLINIFFLLLIIGISIKINILSPWNDVSSLHFCQVIFWTVSLLTYILFSPYGIWRVDSTCGGPLGCFVFIRKLISLPNSIIYLVCYCFPKYFYTQNKYQVPISSICQKALSEKFINQIFHCLYIREHWYLKIKGHFKFYKTVKNYTNFMITTPSFFNVIVILILGVTNKYNLNNVKFLRLHYIIGGVLTLQLIIVICTTIVYIVSIHKFNTFKPVPDTEHNDYFLLSDAACSSEIGYRLNGEAVADLLEKQADLIYYLKSSITEMNNKFVNRC